MTQQADALEQLEPELEAIAQRAAAILMRRLGATGNRQFAAEIHHALIVADDALCQLHGFARKAREGRVEVCNG